MFNIRKNKSKHLETELVEEVRNGIRCLVEKPKEHSVNEYRADKIWESFQKQQEFDRKLKEKQEKLNKKKEEQYNKLKSKDEKKKAKEKRKEVSANEAKKKREAKSKKEEVTEVTLKKHEFIELESDKVEVVTTATDEDLEGLRKRIAKHKEHKKKLKEDKEILKKEINELIKNWRGIMWQAKVYDSSFNTFRLTNINKTDYGWWFKVKAPIGLPLTKLDSLVDTIQSGLGCRFMFNIDLSNDYATCNVIYEGKVNYNDMPFKPLKVKPYEVYPGVTVDGKPLIMNLIVSPHIMIAGGTRRGKNGAADSIIMSWINSCNEDELNLYLFQCAKMDLVKYKKCKQVKSCVVEEFDKMYQVMQHIIEVEIPKRMELFEEMFVTRTGENIYDYNELHPEEPLPYVILIFDEFATLAMKTNGDTEVNENKDGIMTFLQKIGSMGAAVGIFYMIMHQKPEKALCPTFIKNMSSIRICFGFEDDSPGRIVLGEKDGALVHNLPARRAYVNNNGKMDLIYTTNLAGRRDAYIRPHEVEDKTDFFDLKKEVDWDKLEPGINKEFESANNNDVVERHNNGTAILPKKAKSKNMKEKDLEQIKEDLKNKEKEEKSTTIEDIKEDAINSTDLNVIKKELEIAVKELAEAKKQYIEATKGLIDTTTEIITTNTIVASSDIRKDIQLNETKNKPILETVPKEKAINTKNDVLEVVENSKEHYIETVAINNSESSSLPLKKQEKLKVNNVIDINTNNKQTEVDIIDDRLESILAEVDDIVATNAKKNPTWVPYEPREGDKVVNMTELQIAKAKLRKES